jgi:hypothetical protein
LCVGNVATLMASTRAGGDRDRHLMMPSALTGLLLSSLFILILVAA